MHLAQDKKGIEFATLLEMLLLLVAAGLIIYVISYIASSADEKTSENLCRGFNAWGFRTNVDTPIGSYDLAPNACKTIDKGDLPTKEYKNNIDGVREGAKTEIRNLMARCWWMWLEGKQQNMFDSKWYNLQNGCFICYTFSVDKNIKGISYEEFSASLNAPYYAVDSTDRCAPAGQGGKCASSCDISSTYFSKEVASNRCKDTEKCCIADDTRDECKNKGGRCLNEPESPYTEYYSKWQCKSGSCYIKKENFASYLDYIQGTTGSDGGAGKVLFLDNDGFASGYKYAITFISPGKSWNIYTLLGTAETAAFGAAAVVGIFSGVGTVPTLLALGSAAGMAYLTSGTTEFTDINMIAISKFDTVKDKCAIQAGVGEKS